MRHIAICGDNVHALVAQPGFVTTVKIDGVPVHCGLIYTRDTQFDNQSPENALKVLVKIKAFSCNYRDKALILRTATQAPAHWFNVIGSEFVGEVIDAGAEVTGFQVGDRVIGNNAYPDSGVEGLPAGVPTNQASKEYRVFHQAKLIKVPPEMPDQIAAAFSIGAQTAYSMVRKLQITEGANVLVTAAKSNTSLFVIQALKKYNVNLYATSTSRKFEQELLNLGVKRLIQIQPDSDEWIDAELVQEIQTEIHGFDCIVDPFFDLHIGKLIPALKAGGRYITCGLYDQCSEFTNQSFEYKGMAIRELFVSMMFGNVQIIGNCIGLTEDLQQAIEDYINGKFDVLVDSVFTGNEVAKFFDRTFNDKDRFGKVVYQYT
ncbi:zinc-binding alcohol dehydrogenase family protein [Leptothermofonsia sichuanensis E412]|uniref:quinone oxidoreductase family protein n=1 Tax=Leptothermofonsia sichuanensis TaxID=2917832 RepID=UPI001CA6BF70|nr:zinc-binding alcohol dehydrogenase family protein [Leptothermofonsia sichuanensis]QZZ21562.1 zinc-binding alcohol dehydrogenase family protein [Leptothermofonsia sichuanensis E412]